MLVRVVLIAISLTLVTGCQPAVQTPQQSAPSSRSVATLLNPTVALEMINNKVTLGYPAATTISPDGSRAVALIYARSGDQMVTWDTRSGSIVSQWELPRRVSSWARDLSCSADARIICCGGPALVAWDSQSQKEAFRLEIHKPKFAVSFDGQMIALGKRNDVVLLDSLTGEENEPVKKNSFHQRRQQHPRICLRPLWPIAASTSV